MKEVWKPIKGYEGLYEISNLGKIKSLKRILIYKNGHNRPMFERIMTARVSKGYLCVNLYKNGKIKTSRIHRLVAEAFVPNPYNKPYIDHIDTIKTNNRYDNLRWVTPKENTLNPITLNRIISIIKREDTIKNRIKACKTSNSKPVVQCTKDMIFVTEYKSATEAAKFNGFNRRNISHCCEGKRKTCSGYIWKYKE